MSDTPAALLIWLAGLGVPQFSALWLAVMCLDAGRPQKFYSGGLEPIIAECRPVSMGRRVEVARLLTAGVILQWTTS